MRTRMRGAAASSARLGRYGWMRGSGRGVARGGRRNWKRRWHSTTTTRTSIASWRRSTSCATTWYRARYHQERALSLNPNYDLVVVQQGEMLTWLGRRRKGAEWIRKAMRLNPHHPERFWSHLGKAHFNGAPVWRCDRGLHASVEHGRRPARVCRRRLYAGWATQRLRRRMRRKSGKSTRSSAGKPSCRHCTTAGPTTPPTCSMHW